MKNYNIIRSNFGGSFYLLTVSFLSCLIFFSSGCSHDLITSEDEVSSRVADADEDLTADTCHDPQLPWSAIVPLVDVSGEVAYFATEHEWHTFRSQVGGLSYEDNILLVAALAASASYDLLPVVYDAFYASVEQDSTEEHFLAEVQANADILQVIDRPDGDQELVHVYESMDPTGRVVDRNSIFKVNDQYGKLIGGTVLWSDNYDELVAITSVPTSTSEGSSTELYNIIAEDDIVDPRSSCNHLNVGRIRSNQIDPRWCRRDRRLSFHWKVYETTAFEVDRGAGITDKFIDVRTNFRSRGYKKYACIWARYSTIHYRRNANFDVTVKYKDNSGNTISEFDFEPYTAPQRVDRSAITWEDDTRLLTYLKDNSFKVEACWTRERIDV
jgi:hypothetical protein